MKKRFSAFLLAALMVASLLPVMSFAATMTATDFLNLKVGGEIKLTENVTLSETATLSENVTLDLNGYTITGPNSGWVLKVTGGTLTLTDSSADKDGKIEGANCISVRPGANLIMDGGNLVTAGYGIQVYDSAATMNGGSIQTAEHGVVIYGQGTVATFQMTNGTIEADLVGVIGHGTYHKANVTISGGSITSNTAVAVSWPASGKLTIAGGELTGGTAVYVKAGSVEITGGKLHGNGDESDYASTGSGGAPTGDALVIDNAGGGYAALSDVVVSGGTFTSANAAPVASYAPNGSTAKDKFITGGSFPTAAEGDMTDLLADGANVQIGAPVYGGPVMNWVKCSAAENGVVKSGPLAASEGATITLYPKAASGYVLDTVEVLDAEGNAVELDGLKFQVPLGGVTVNATFKLAE